MRFRVGNLAMQRLEDFPVPVASGGPMFDPEKHVQIRLNAVIVQQRVVDVEQQDEIVCHFDLSASVLGLRQGPSEPISATASSGPQVPGS